jgi:hypothetical protein
MIDHDTNERDTAYKWIEEPNPSSETDHVAEMDVAVPSASPMPMTTTDLIETSLVVSNVMGPFNPPQSAHTAVQLDTEAPTGASANAEISFESSDMPNADIAFGATIDYAAFTFKAVVDWIEVTVTLPAASQPRHVRDRMPFHWHLPYVTAETDDASRTATGFTFRVQNPSGPGQLLHDAQLIVQSGQPPLDECNVEIKGIEVSFDAYSNTQDRSALIAITEEMIWTQSLLASPARLCPYFDKPGVANRGAVRRLLEDGSGTFNAGDKSSDFAQRWYLKTYDSRGGESYTRLPAAEHCARAEVTLRGSRLPFTTLKDWREFRFETLRTPYFSWRVPHESVRLAHTLPPWMEQFRSLGLVEGSARRRMDRRKSKPGTRPNFVLQQYAKNALERLTRQQRRH